MRTYLVSPKNAITISTSVAAKFDAEIVTSPKDLDAKRFPLARLVEVWNGLPSATPVKRFKDRKSAIKRLWDALEALPVSGGRQNSKQSAVIALLSRPTGASLGDLTAATGWQAHSVRGVLSGVLRKKLGLNVVSVVDGNTRVYRIDQ
jgi:hypothetical protein